ncbi:MAG: hypothetical protein ACE5GB_07115 [Acidimicrobiales bacterium]
MATKREVQKRRVQAQRRAAAQARAAARKDRRRRLVVGGLAGVLAVAMVASVGAGFFLGGGTGDDADDRDLDVTLDDPPVVIDPVPPGASISGDTPCPTTDGTPRRTTGFETAPALCIDPEADYEFTLTTDRGDIVVTLDPDLDVDVVNLIVTFARYGVYDGMPLALIADQGLLSAVDSEGYDPGVAIPGRPPAGESPYRVGTVLAQADFDGEVSYALLMITGAEAAAILNQDPVHPVIGTITSGGEVADAIVAEAGSPGGVPTAEERIVSVTVTEVAG